MSILTKIAIVLLVIVSIAASVVFTAQATVQESYRSQFEQQKTKTLAMEAQARRAQIAAERQAHINAINQATSQGQIAQLRNQVQTVEARETDYQKQIQDLEVQRATAVAQVSDLNQSLGKEIEQRERIRQQLTGALEEKDRLAKLNLEYSQANTDLSGQIERLQKQVQVRLEEIAQLEEQMQDLRDRLEDALSRGPTTVAGGTGQDTDGQFNGQEQKISGTITAVKNDIASIDAGSAAGVTKGMRFVIYRGENFVGYLNIEVVEASKSAGFVSGGELQAQIGDRVTNKLAR
ncbi:MAG: hypothetical protein ACLFUJ_13165 [Phycisphaerae bacterium]